MSTTPAITPATTPRTQARPRLAALLTAAALAGGAGGAGTVAALTGWSPAGAQHTVASAPVDDTTTGTSASGSVIPAGMTSVDGVDWSATAAKVSPSVVSIAVRTAGGQGAGSGVVIDREGHVLTNAHVVDGASGGTVTVTLSDDRAYEATIVGADPSSDLAVLRLQGAGDLTPVAVGDSGPLRVGQPVMAVGNPLGLSGTVTTGIVSALDRPVTTEGSGGGQGGAGQGSPFGSGGRQSAATASAPVVTNAIQTSAAINPGNSGGALVDSAGRLVGISSSIATLGGAAGGQSGSIGIGFAIPSTEAMRVAGQIIEDGAASHGWLGVQVGERVVADGDARRSAAVIEQVQDGSPAAKAGLRQGDAVLAMDGEAVDGQLSLIAQVHERAAGSTATLTVARDGARRDLEVTLGEQPS